MDKRMEYDPSNGYEAVATEFMKRRHSSSIGVAAVRKWAKALPPGASIVDVGCGDGVPIAAALIEDGFRLFGIDASAAMIQAFQERFPDVPVVHEPAEQSSFFHRTFDGALAWGLLFLLALETQERVIQRMGDALSPGGRLLFTSPEQSCQWFDVLTGRKSVSLGTDTYCRIASEAGLAIVDRFWDEGDNHYFSFVKVT